MLVKLFLLCLLIYTALGPDNSRNSAGEKIKICRRGGNSNHYLEWKGKPILLIGDSVTLGWMECGINFDQFAYIDALAARGINFLMIWSYTATNASIQKKDFRIGYDSPEIWPWNGSPDSKNFNLTRLNQVYFNRLKKLVAYAESNGIAVLITVHDGWTKRRFQAHPFNNTLGNGPLKNKYQYVTLHDYKKEMPRDFNPLWNWMKKNQYFQERFCEKLIEELNPFSNVMYEMFNEGEWYNPYLRKKHEDHFLNFFRLRCNNILVVNTDQIAGKDPHKNSKADVISLHGNWLNRFNDFQLGFRAEPVKPYLFTEPVRGWAGNDSLNVVRRSMWETALAGAGWVNQNDCSFGWDPKTLMAAKKNIMDSAYDLAGHCSRFFNRSGIDFVNMEPKGDLSSTGICFIKKSSECAIYLPESNKNDSVKVDLELSASYGLYWYNPGNGEYFNGGSFNGRKISFTKPDDNDWVLHVKIKK